MEKQFKDQIIIDGLQYCNWDRGLFEDIWKGGLTAVHVTVVYWENTQESFQKLKEWDTRFTKHSDIICHAKNTQDILEAKKIIKLQLFLVFKIKLPLPMIFFF